MRPDPMPSDSHADPRIDREPGAPESSVPRPGIARPARVSHRFPMVDPETIAPRRRYRLHGLDSILAELGEDPDAS